MCVQPDCRGSCASLRSASARPQEPKPAKAVTDSRDAVYVGGSTASRYATSCKETARERTHRSCAARSFCNTAIGREPPVAIRLGLGTNRFHNVSELRRNNRRSRVASRVCVTGRRMVGPASSPLPAGLSNRHRAAIRRDGRAGAAAASALLLCLPATATPCSRGAGRERGPAERLAPALPTARDRKGSRAARD